MRARDFDKQQRIKEAMVSIILRDGINGASIAKIAKEAEDGAAHEACRDHKQRPRGVEQTLDHVRHRNTHKADGTRKRRDATGKQTRKDDEHRRPLRSRDHVAGNTALLALP